MMIGRTLTILAFLFPAQVVRAEGGHIEKIVEEVSREKEKLAEGERKKRNVLGELYAVNKDLKKINSEKAKIERGLRGATENVHALQTLIAQLDDKIKRQRVRLRMRMKALSKVQGQGVTRVFFGSNSSSELDANFRIFRIITERDFRMLRNYRENLRVFAAQKSRLGFQEKKYADLKKRLDEKQKMLATQIDKKNVMVKSIDSSRILHLAKIRRLKLETVQSAKNDLELRKVQALEELFRPQIFEKKGELPAPVEGSLLQGFGLLEDRDSNTKLRFKGNSYAVAEGSSVKAVFAGRVVYAGYLEGYGNTVIVDHGDNYYSVYANQKSLEVEEGAFINDGKVIGYAGRGETFMGPGLYFELRHFSEPEDPSVWLKKSKKDI